VHPGPAAAVAPVAYRPGRRPADRTGAEAGHRPARARPDHGPGRGPLRTTAGEAGAARRAEEAVAGDPPLGVPRLRGLLREGPRDRRGRPPGQPERGRPQAAGPLTGRPAPAGRTASMPVARRRPARPLFPAPAPGARRLPPHMTDKLRFPAEWEPQSAILIAWPHAGTDWAERLGEVEETYVALSAAVTRFLDCWICVGDDDVETCAEARLRSPRV